MVPIISTTPGDFQDAFAHWQVQREGAAVRWRELQQDGGETSGIIHNVVKPSKPAGNDCYSLLLNMAFFFG